MISRPLPCQLQLIASQLYRSSYHALSIAPADSCGGGGGGAGGGIRWEGRGSAGKGKQLVGGAVGGAVQPCSVSLSATLTVPQDAPSHHMDLPCRLGSTRLVAQLGFSVEGLLSLCLSASPSPIRCRIGAPPPPAGPMAAAPPVTACSCLSPALASSGAERCKRRRAVVGMRASPGR